MTARTEGLLLITLILAMSFVFQIQLKLFADQVAPVLSNSALSFSAKLGELFHASLAWRPVMIATLAILLFVTWFLALTRVELSLALPVASVALVVNAIGSGLLLGEGLSPLRIAGVLTVAAGITMVLKS